MNRDILKTVVVLHYSLVNRYSILKLLWNNWRDVAIQKHFNRNYCKTFRGGLQYHQTVGSFSSKHSQNLRIILPFKEYCWNYSTCFKTSSRGYFAIDGLQRSDFQRNRVRTVNSPTICFQSEVMDCWGRQRAIILFVQKASCWIVSFLFLDSLLLL